MFTVSFKMWICNKYNYSAKYLHTVLACFAGNVVWKCGKSLERKSHKFSFPTWCQQLHFYNLFCFVVVIQLPLFLYIQSQSKVSVIMERDLPKNYGASPCYFNFYHKRSVALILKDFVTKFKSTGLQLASLQTYFLR